MLKPHVLLKPNCSISHPVEFYELDEFRVSIKKWQSGIVQWFQTKMRGNGFSNNRWIQTPVESKQWCNDSFAPRGWWRCQTLISTCSCLRLHSLKRSHDHCWSWQLTEILEKKPICWCFIYYVSFSFLWVVEIGRYKPVKKWNIITKTQCDRENPLII